MAYLQCQSCKRTAWLDSTTEPALLCSHCATALTPMPAAHARKLVAAVRERFERDAELDVGRPRFVRD